MFVPRKKYLIDPREELGYLVGYILKMAANGVSTNIVPK